MRILYGVQGTGNGHITRARAMSSEFAKTNVHVDYLFSGRTENAYFHMQPFGNYRTYSGLTFTTINGSVLYLRTALNNKFLTFIRDVKALDLADYDLVITDFEPITAWAAKLRKKPVIGIGHQYAFNYRIPVKGSNLIARAILKYFAPADLSLGAHWHHFDNPILPPIIEPPQFKSRIVKNKIIVYLPFEDINQICRWLSPHREFQFHVYHSLSFPGDRGHIHLLPLSRNAFQQDLASCDGVITNSGFGLLSETLQYGKKILSKPLKGQMEQISNAEVLKILEKGDIINELDVFSLSMWLQKENPPPVYYPNVAEAIVKWIIDGRTEPIDSVAERLWSACNSAVDTPRLNFPVDRKNPARG